MIDIPFLFYYNPVLLNRMTADYSQLLVTVHGLCVEC